MTCSRTNALDAMEALLARDADVNAKEKSLSQTALMWAASEGHREAIQVLLKHGPDVHARRQADRVRSSWRPLAATYQKHKHCWPPARTLMISQKPAPLVY